MNADNSNLENNIGSESFAVPQTPVNPEPVNNTGEETFNPFQDLNSAPLNVPEENLGQTPNISFDAAPADVPTMQPSPVEPAPAAPVDNTFAQPSFSEPVPSEPSINVGEPVSSAPVVDTFEPVQTSPVVDTFNQEVTTPSVDAYQATPNVAPVETFEPAPAPEAPVQSAPKMSVYVQPQNDVDVTPAPAAPTGGIGLNDYVTQNTTQIQAINDESLNGPAIPIPDKMPTVDYQAEVSTPVDYATPMSDFDQIGTTPELDPNVKPKRSNKGLIGLLLILVVAALGGGAYYLINVVGIFNSDNVTLNEMTAEKGETLSVNIDDYATFKNTSSSNCALDTSKVDVSKTGTYDFTITCGDKVYTGKVTVKDTKGPDVEFKTWIIVPGTTLGADALKDTANEDATYAYASETETENYQTAGLKKVKVIATDSLSNSKTYVVPVIVTSYEYSFGIVAKKDVTGENPDATIIEKNVIFYNGSAGMVNDTSYTAYIIKFNNDTAYKTVKSNYDDSGSLTYETFTGTPLFYSSTNTLVLVKDINTDLIKSEYNETYMNLRDNAGYETFQVNQNSSNKDLVNFNG